MRSPKHGCVLLHHVRDFVWGLLGVDGMWLGLGGHSKACEMSVLGEEVLIKSTERLWASEGAPHSP